MINYSNSVTEQQMIAETKKFVNKKTRELTQAEYDALSTAEKNNGVIYFITDGAGGSSDTVLTGVLSAGSTEISFTDSNITSSSIIDVYADVYGINANNISVNNNTLTLTFDAQSTDVNIKVKIS